MHITGWLILYFVRVPRGKRDHPFTLRRWCGRSREGSPPNPQEGRSEHCEVVRNHGRGRRRRSIGPCRLRRAHDWHHRRGLAALASNKIERAAGQPWSPVGGAIPRLRSNSLNSSVLTCARFPSTKGARGSGGPPSTLLHSMMGHISVLRSSTQWPSPHGSCQGWHTAGNAGTRSVSTRISPGSIVVQLVTSTHPSSVSFVSPAWISSQASGGK